MKNLVNGLIAGAVLGVVAGLFFAPAKGEKTRKKFLKGTKNLKSNVVEYVDGSIDDLRSQLNDKIDQLAKRGKETINHVSEKVKI